MVYFTILTKPLLWLLTCKDKTVWDYNCAAHTHIMKMKRKPRGWPREISALFSNKSEISNEYKW